ncbi:MAG: hypothetical protein V4813_17140 [Gemmatimonadota bacterium]
MVRRWLTPIFTVLVVAAPTSAAQRSSGTRPGSFIATVTMNEHSSDGTASAKSGVVTIRVHGGRARVDYPSNFTTAFPGSYYLFSAEQRYATLVVPAERAFVVLTPASDSSMTRLLAESPPAFSDVSGFRDSLGSGETILGFTSRKVRMGIGLSMTTAPLQWVESMTMRSEIETETHASDEIDALAPGFAAVWRDADAEVGNAIFRGDSAVLRAVAMIAPPRGFPLLRIRTHRSIMGDDTTVVTQTMRLQTLERADVRLDDMTVPAGFTATSGSGLRRLRQEREAGAPSGERRPGSAPKE